ncbi:type IV toxin-antitoxin system AbiEi family antitoxin domain-containing protein [Nocardioides dongxiaopingii]|uniref:type IV toxin-antitoxin system AbiEi family antitoxin domain-containing protein n=1 Tax=Nocardioides sp. S-1144 TaxID=2582905 RepID=UPI0037C7F499
MAVVDALDDLVAQQAGVVSRGQLLAHGLAATDVRRRLRRRELVTVVPGVYVDHTGTASASTRPGPSRARIADRWHRAAGSSASTAAQARCRHVSPRRSRCSRTPCRHG